MATATTQLHSSVCDEEKETYICTGCSTAFCFIHLTEHREGIDQEFIQIEHHCNSFRQTILDQKTDPNKHPLIQEIEQWKQESIQKIEKIANQCQQRLIRYTNQFLIETENQLNQLTEQLKQIRQKNKLNEFDLDQLKNKLTKLQKELEKPSNVSIKQQPTSFINKISVIISFPKDTKWKQQGITVAGGNGKGNQLNQLFCPRAITIDDDQTLFIADGLNHRIVEWKSNATNGRVVAGGNGKGSQTNQLDQPKDVIFDHKNHSLIISDQGNRRVIEWSCRNPTKHGQILLSGIDCRGLTMDKNGSLYVSDFKKDEVRRWKRGEDDGTIVAGGNGNGEHLNQFDFPTYISVDEDESLFVSDTKNHRVMKWMKDAKEGMLVAGGNGEGESLSQLSAPRGVVVDPLGQIYVADCCNDRVIRWCEGEKKGTIVVGGNGRGEQSNQFNCPIGLSFDPQGNLYVVDCGNHRIQKFELDEKEKNMLD